MDVTQPTSSKTSSARGLGLIIIALDLILLIALLNFLPFDQKANTGLALTVFVGVLWLTEAIHVTITALLIPLLAIVLGILDTTNALKSFSNPIIFLFFGGFALATALHIQGLDRLIANRLLRLAKGRLSVAVMLIFAVTAGISMWINNTATAAMMLPLALGILANIDYQKERKTFVFILLGIAYSASIGGMGTLIGSAPNAIAAAQVGIDFLSWLKFGIPLVLVLMPLMIGLLYLMLRPNLNYQIAISEEKVAWTPMRLVTISIFALTVACWIFSRSLSAWFGGIPQFDSVVAIAAAILICISGVASWRQIQENTEWGVLLLFGGGLTLSIILQSSGASAIIAHGIIQVFGENHWAIIMLVVAAFIIFLTDFTSNTASAALLVPIFASVAQALGMPAIVLVMIIGFGASCAFMLPVATPPNAIVFGTGYIKQNDMIKVGFVLNLLCIAVITAFAWFYWL